MKGTFIIVASLMGTIACELPFQAQTAMQAPTSKSIQGPPDRGLLTNKEVSLHNVAAEKLSFQYSTDGGYSWNKTSLAKGRIWSLSLQSQGNNYVPLKLRDADNSCPSIQEISGGYQVDIYYQKDCLTISKLIDRS